MQLLVFNSGSSSLKFQLFDADGDVLNCIARGVVRDFGSKASCHWEFNGRLGRTVIAAADHQEAAEYLLNRLANDTGSGASVLDTITAVGHRVVHGGSSFANPVLITDQSFGELEQLNALAPLHNPPALAVIRACQQRLPQVPAVAVFDTAFFCGLPDYVRTYALPKAWTERPQEIRRFGFHGLAHRFMVQRYRELHDSSPAHRVITMQLGYGCSVAAIENGRAIETSMGFTPLEGLIMATRPGDVDVGAILELIERDGKTVHELSDGLNHQAGLLGLSGISADMKNLLELEAQGHAGAALAVRAFCHRARKYLGAYLAVLGGADAIIFGGGIGEHLSEIRRRICSGMEWCGLNLDQSANAVTAGTENQISAPGSAVKILVIPVDEEILIARDTWHTLKEALARDSGFSI